MKTPLACLLAACLFAGSAFAQSVQPIDRIAAVVNDDVVLQSELDRAIHNVLAQYAKQPGAQLPPADILRKQVLERLIVVHLQVAQAAEQGIRVSDQDVDATVGNVAGQNGMTADQMRANLARDGVDFASFRDSIRDEIAIQRLRQRYAQTSVNVSDAEVDAALAAQANGMQFHLANLVVALPQNPTPDQIALAEKKITGVKDLIDKGQMDFAAAAARYSDGQNALEGGDLGWRSSDEIPSAFASMITGMQAGQVIGPIRGASGYQLLKLVETRSGGGVAGNVEEQRNQIRNQIGQRKLEESWSRYLNELRGDAYVSIRSADGSSASGG